MVRFPERALRTAVGVVFALQFVVLDMAVRGLAGYAQSPRALLALIASAAICGGVLLTPRGEARAILGALLGATLVAQAMFIHFWHVPIDRQIAISAAHHATDVGAVLGTMTQRLAAAFAMGAILGGLAAWFGALPATNTRRAIAVAAAIAGLSFGPPLRSATAEVAAMDALAALTKRRASPLPASAAPTRPRTPIDVPRRALPNVVFVLTESVRASDACSGHEAVCPTMPAMNALVPDRVPLREMRAVSSYTEVSLSALITGRTQTGDRAAIANAPTLFDLVGRIRSGEQKPYVAYWSAQMASVFEHGDIKSATDAFVSVETLVGREINDEDEVVDRGVDRLLVAHAKRELEKLPRPFFLFVQLAGTHAPYFVDEGRAPFAPWSRVVSWPKLGELHNAYRNAIVAQDATLAELVRELFDATRGEPLVIVYTSDHGEAFGEHGAIHHGQNLYDEQIHVPGWIAARGGALAEDTLANVRAHERALVTHLDLLPTILDLYGAWDSFALRSLRAELPGRSLLAPPRPFAPLPITNCTPLFPCPLNAWGMLGQTRTLQAQPWDPHWHCLALGAAAAAYDPTKDAACIDLAITSRNHYPTLPNGKPNR